MLEKNTRKHSPPDLRKRIPSCYAMRLVSKVSGGSSDFGQGRVNRPSPITLSPGLTDHLDEYRPSLLRCSHLVEEVAVYTTFFGNRIHSLI